MMTDGERLDTRVYFKPRPLENLLLVDELASMAPLTDAKVWFPQDSFLQWSMIQY